MFEQLNIRVNFNDADYSNLKFSVKDEQILSRLGKEVAEIAARPIMQERKKLWTAHNKLQKTRPLIFCDAENGWNELIPESAIKCENSIARHWEMNLRKQVYWGNEINDDFVVEPVFNLPYVYKLKEWRMSGREDAQQFKKTAEHGKSYEILTVLDDYSKINGILKPEIVIDYEKTKILLETAKRLFEGSLNARINTVWYWSFGLTDEFVFLRGLQKMMYDFVDQPDELHEVMKLLHDGTQEKLDFLEKNDLFCLNNDGSYVGSGGLGFTDELPTSSFSGKVTTKDMWGLAESQVTVGVSPDMFEEFIFPYQKPLMERFGLINYGCCEPMDKRFDIVKQVKNLRRVSVSAWANREIMADKLKHDYIYSMKPSPAPLAQPKLNEESARKYIKETLQIAKNNCLELIMKDNHTLANNPDNLKNWVRIVREEIENM